MNQILGIGRSGLNAVQYKMDALSDDLANVSTAGYKSKEIRFGELLLNEITENDVLLSENVAEAAISSGTKSIVAKTNFNQGILLPASGQFHIAIEGRGFFGVRDADDNLILTRNGGFHMNENGSITDDSGLLLDMNYTLPFNQWPSSNISISNSGEITANIGEDTIQLGKIILYSPGNTDTLTSLGEGRYMTTMNEPLYNSNEQPELFGRIHQFTLESSNVDTVKSMVEMMIAQRAYSMNSKLIQSTDDIMSVINNIKQ
ncbi:MAG: flagellar hook-basal body protein [Eubacteriales bacterium]